MTNVLYYTWNEGLSWETIAFSDKKFKIQNIIIEPTNTALNFIVYGNNKAGKGVLIDE